MSGAAAARATSRRPKAPLALHMPDLSDDAGSERLDAAQLIATSNDRIADAITAHARAMLELGVTLKPAADTVHGLGDRLDALCRFFRKWGLVGLAGAPSALVMVNAISPKAGEALSHLLAAVGLG